MNGAVVETVAGTAEGTGAAHDSTEAAWSAFAAPASQPEFFARWLELLCQQVGGVRAGLLLVAGDDDHTFEAGALWPESTRDMAHLAPVAQQSLSERRGLVQRDPAGRGAQVAYPVLVAGMLKAAVVLDVAPRAEAALQQALRQLHWGAAWLTDLFRQHDVQASRARAERLALVQSAVGAALQQRGFLAATMAAINLLATRLDCDRVSLGRTDAAGDAVLEAISNTAHFDRRGNLPRQIADAMDEALDARVPVHHPASGDERLLAASHALLQPEGAALSVPLQGQQGPWGVLCFERAGAGRRFTEAERETCAVAGLLLGPVLELAHDNARSWPRRALDDSRTLLRKLFGPRHAGLKLFTLLGVAVLAFLVLAQGDYRISARTVVEGEVQRATVAPFDGYLAESLVRAGDTVRSGQTMARLDDRELRLEQARWQAEHEQHLRRFRQAQASYDRAAMNVLGAQAAQALAQLQLVEERLGRVELQAPFDGRVVSGDLRQLVGTPLEQGRVLFETAPLDAYRVVLQVDERDIARLAVGQRGELVLASLPSARLDITVHQITPVATAEDGRNFFRVEARVDGRADAGQDGRADGRTDGRTDAPVGPSADAAASLAPSVQDRLRPGMEGVAKVQVGEARLLWIWTHRLRDTVSLALWRWLP